MKYENIVLLHWKKEIKKSKVKKKKKNGLNIVFLSSDTNEGM